MSWLHLCTLIVFGEGMGEKIGAWFNRMSGTPLANYPRSSSRLRFLCMAMSCGA